MSETWTIHVFQLHVQLFPFISTDNQEYTVHFKIKFLSKYDFKLNYRSYKHLQHIQFGQCLCSELYR
jgi:hypothetical protein